MTYVNGRNCSKCGAPYYVPMVWGGILPPPTTPTCECNNSITWPAKEYAYSGDPSEQLVYAKKSEIQTYNELITLLSDYCGENGTSESAVETLGRLLEEREHLRLCARRYINAVDGDQEPNLYIAFKAALGEPVV